MKRVFSLMLSVLMIALIVGTFLLPVALSEGDPGPTLVPPMSVTPIQTTTPGTGDEPFTWAYLATIAGATAFTLLVVQFLKAPLDKVWKIPTRLFVYLVALVTMLLATAFTGGLNAQNTLLAAVNAVVVSMAAFGAYEITFNRDK